jgi:hypothetical protein
MITEHIRYLIHPHKVFASKDVIFHENANEGNEVDIYDAWPIPYDENVKEEADDEHKQGEELNDMDPTSNQSTPRGGEDSSPSKGRGESSEAPRRSSRQTRLPERYKDYALMTEVMNVIEPLNFKQANEHKEWRNAMKEEYESIMKNDT